MTASSDLRSSGMFRMFSMFSIIGFLRWILITLYNIISRTNITTQEEMDQTLRNESHVGNGYGDFCFVWPHKPDCIPDSAAPVVPFRYLDLPTEIQLLIIQHVVNGVRENQRSDGYIPLSVYSFLGSGEKCHPSRNGYHVQYGIMESMADDATCLTNGKTLERMSRVSRGMRRQLQDVFWRNIYLDQTLCSIDDAVSIVGMLEERPAIHKAIKKLALGSGTDDQQSFDSEIHSFNYLAKHLVLDQLDLFISTNISEATDMINDQNLGWIEAFRNFKLGKLRLTLTFETPFALYPEDIYSDATYSFMVVDGCREQSYEVESVGGDSSNLSEDTLRQEAKYREVTRLLAFHLRPQMPRLDQAAC